MKSIQSIIISFCSLWLFNGINGSINAQTLHTIRPSETDSMIVDHDNNHFIYFENSLEPKNELFLFFPGTGGSPINYRLILQEAANLGYHSIGLTYPNTLTVNGVTVCGLAIDTTCHSRARQEIFDGIDRHPTIDVDTINCIQNRLKKLLLHLELLYPEEEWGQYLDDQQEILWNKIKLAGHSQGGGHAGFIGKQVEVERAIMIANNDWIGLRNRSADWFSLEGATPTQRYFSLHHAFDELVDFDNVITSLNNLGLFENNILTLVDSNYINFKPSNTLYTEILPRNNLDKFHGSVAVDIWTPLNEEDKPVLAPVWEFLIDSPINNSTSVHSIENKLDFTIYPNPSNGLIRIQNNEDFELYFEIKNITGLLVWRSKIQLGLSQINLTHLQDGIYLIKMRNELGITIIQKWIKQ